jgi:cytochrome c
MIRELMIATFALAASVAASFAQAIGAGETSFKSKCLMCHDVGENAKNKLGPPLNGLEGHKAGTGEGFTFNAGLKDSGITWNADTFKEFIHDPRAKIPDTKMFFPGIKDDTEIGNLWAYLVQFGPDGRRK